MQKIEKMTIDFKVTLTLMLKYSNVTTIYYKEGSVLYTVRSVTDDLYWVGGNDHRLALYESVHPIPRGLSYNAYLLADEKTVLFDTVDWRVCPEMLRNIESILDGRPLDYLLINHLEPDHAGSVEEIVLRYPNVTVICTEKASTMMRQYGYNIQGREDKIKEGDFRCFGKHTITFVSAPMAHMPEAIVAYDVTDGVLFSADGFGSFGALDGKLFNDEVDFHRDWIDDARRYLTNIVGIYGPFVQALLKRASTVDIKIICPLHGPVWRSDFGYIIDKYDKWIRYVPEEKGVLIVYASMYGNTEYAAQALATRLCEKGMCNVAVYDVSNTHVSYLISETFRLSHIVLASVTYNHGIYPPMQNYLMDMKALNLQNRTFSIVENGSWAPKSGDLMREFVENELKMTTVLDESMTVTPSLNELDADDLDAMADSIIESMNQE